MKTIEMDSDFFREVTENFSHADLSDILYDIFNELDGRPWNRKSAVQVVEIFKSELGIQCEERKGTSHAK